jgi:hypothetical protein
MAALLQLGRPPAFAVDASNQGCNVETVILEKNSNLVEGGLMLRTLQIFGL